MRMKEDHMLNGQLKPGYNFQISTNNQYIVNYSLHPTTADTTTLQEHTQIYKQQYQQLPGTITADAGYGSEENYQYLQENNIENYVKYNYFDKEQSHKADKKYPFKADTLYYNSEKDFYVCPSAKEWKTLVLIKRKPKPGLHKRLPATRRKIVTAVRFDRPVIKPKATGLSR